MIDIIVLGVIIGLICGATVIFFTDNECEKCNMRQKRIDKDNEEERIANNIARKVEQVIIDSYKNV